MESAARMIEERTESDLLADLQNGNREAFGALYVRHQKRVYSIALNFFAGDQARAGDIVQHVFLKLFRTPSDFRGDAEFTTWIYRVTVNACIDEQRKLRRFFGLEDFFGLGDDRPRPDQAAQDSQLSEIVRSAIGTLKPKYRLPIVLKYSEGLSYQEIAAVLDCSVGTVSSRINRGHKMLAKKLGHMKDRL